MPLTELWLLPVGVFVGIYGTIIGAGGGFLLVPLLIAIAPSYSTSMITAASLSVVCANALSGTAAYARMRRISYRSGLVLAVATVPGAVAGSYLTELIPRRVFNWIFGGLLVAVAVFLSVTRMRRSRSRAKGPARVTRGPRVTDTVSPRDGEPVSVSFNLWLGVGLSFAVGAFSSLVGIGGGLIHVPLLTYLFGFPIHVATATSHFVLVITALAGVITHIADGSFPRELPRLAILAVGVIGGAQLGAPLSRRISGPWIAVGLAAALAAVGIRLIVAAL
jgi:uncharacterized protein